MVDHRRLGGWGPAIEPVGDNGSDALAILPEPAREKLRRMREELSTLFLVATRASEEKSELTRETAQISSQLNPGRIDPDDPHVKVAQARIERLNADIARLAEARDVRDNRIAALGPSTPSDPRRSRAAKPRPRSRRRSKLWPSLANPTCLLASNIPARWVGRSGGCSWKYSARRS